MPGPGYLVVVVKLANADSSFIESQLRGALSNYGSASGQSIARDGRRIVNGISDLLHGIVGGFQRGDLWVGIPGTNATLRRRTITCTQANAAGNNVTFTCGGVAIALTEGVDFARGASDTTCAAALAAAINAQAVLKAIFTASNSSGVVNLDSKLPGFMTDDWILSTDDATAFAIALTGGATVAPTYGTARVALRNVLMGKTP